MLIVYSIFIKTQDLREHENVDLFNSSKSPLVAENIQSLLAFERKNQHRRTNAEESSTYEVIDNKPKKHPVQIKIEVKSKVIFRHHEAFYEIKINLNQNEKTYKVWKSLKNFLDLEKTLLKDVQSKATLFCKSFEDIVCFSNCLDCKDSHQAISLSNCTIIQTFNEYLNKLTNYLELMNIYVVLFLDIPEPYRKLILQANNQQLERLIETKSRKPMFNKDCSKTLNEIYFDVFEMEFIQECENFMTIELHLLELPSEKWIATRKKTEIIDFVKKYKSIFLEDSLFGEHNLKEKFKRVCNESKENFIDKEFLEFLGVGERTSNMIKIANSDTEKRLMKELKIEIVDVMEIFNKDKQKESLYYNILVESEEKNDKKVVFFKNIYKKYGNFKELHTILLKKFHDYVKDLPNLPEKPEISGIECKSCELKEELEWYLRQLIKFPYISQSLAFRRFLNVCFLKGSFIEEPFVERRDKMTFFE